MPIYEYQCGACGHRLDALQKFSDEPLKDCPNCHQATLNKLVSAAGFQLKGSGWYATDYRDKGKPQKTNKDEGGTESGSNTSTETKSSDSNNGTTT